MNDDGYEEKSKHIMQLASLPADQLIDYFADIHPHVDSVAPNITPQIFATASRSIQYLSSKLPKSSSTLPFDKQTNPSKLQKKKWLDIYNAIDDPISILKEVKKGTLTSHQKDAVKTVYPELFNEMKQKMLEQMALTKNNYKIPNKTKMSIWQFLEIPLKSTMTPQSLQAIIRSANRNQSQEQQNQMRNKVSGAQLSQINKVNDIYPTSLQARESQKQKMKLGK